jgi:anti-anti-sigma factor
VKGLAEVTVTVVAGVPVVRLEGEVDLSNVDEVRRAVFEPAEAGHDCVVVDLTGTTYLDSTAVRLLFDLAVRLQARRRRMRLVVSDATIVRRVLVLTKLDASVPFDATVEDAVGHCADLEEHDV